MFFVIRFMIVWTIWILFADKRRWRELFIVGFFAGFLGSTTDNIMTYYKLWDYQNTNIHTVLPKLMDDWGIYIVVTYFFIQWLPKSKNFWSLFGYWFIWTSLAIGIEWIHLKTNHMKHFRWWTLWHSYMADWVLFTIFYQFHKIFKLENLGFKKGTAK
jgi:hypothetical protein